MKLGLEHKVSHGTWNREDSRLCSGDQQWQLGLDLPNNNPEPKPFEPPLLPDLLVLAFLLVIRHN